MTDINVNFDKCGFFAKKFLNGYITANLIEFGTNRYGFIISIFDLNYNFIGSYADYIYSDFSIANYFISDNHSKENKETLEDIIFDRTNSNAHIHRANDLL